MIQTLEEKRAKQRDYMKVRRKDSEFKAKLKVRRQSPEWKAHRQTQEWKASRKARKQKPERKAKQKAKKQTSEWKTRRKAQRKTPERRAQQHKHRLSRLQTEPKFYLVSRLRIQLKERLLNYSKSRKTKRASQYGIDYNKIINYLKPTIEKQKANHIDHIIPASRFDLNNESEIRFCFSPENLQWLSGPENLSKNDNIRKEDLLELQRRINEDSEKLDINILNKLLRLGEMIYAKEQNSLNDLPLVAVK